MFVHVHVCLCLLMIELTKDQDHHSGGMSVRMSELPDDHPEDDAKKKNQEEKLKQEGKEVQQLDPNVQNPEGQKQSLQSQMGKKVGVTDCDW